MSLCSNDNLVEYWTIQIAIFRGPEAFKKQRLFLTKSNNDRSIER